MIDPRERFVMEPQTSLFESVRNGVRGWYQRVFARKPEPEPEHKAAPAKRNPPRRAAPFVVAKTPALASAPASAPQPPILQPPPSEPSDIRDEGYTAPALELAPTIDPASASAAP
jgi:penicillin-binding protein 1A